MAFSRIQYRVHTNGSFVRPNVVFHVRQEFSSTTMETLSSRHYGTVAEQSPNTSYIFTADIFDDHATISPSPRQDATGLRSALRAKRRPPDTTGTITPKAKTDNTALNRRVAFTHDPTEQQQSSIHPAFRPRPVSGRAGDVTAIDHLIAKHGGATSTFAELPHELQIAKKDPPLTLTEQVKQLTRQNGNLLEELAFFKDIRNAEMTFLRKMHKLHGQLREALGERSRERASAELKFTTYWGINLNEGSVEDNVF